MFAPHHRKYTQLGNVRRAPEDLLDPFKLVPRDPMSRNDLGCYGYIILHSIGALYSTRTPQTKPIPDKRSQVSKWHNTPPNPLKTNEIQKRMYFQKSEVSR